MASARMATRPDGAKSMHPAIECCQFSSQGLSWRSDPRDENVIATVRPERVGDPRPRRGRPCPRVLEQVGADQREDVEVQKSEADDRAAGSEPGDGCFVTLLREVLERGHAMGPTVGVMDPAP